MKRKTQEDFLPTHGPMYLIRNYRRIKQSYGSRMKLLQGQSNLLRLQFYSIAFMLAGVFSLLLISSLEHGARLLFLFIIVYSAVVFTLSTYFIKYQSKKNLAKMRIWTKFALALFFFWGAAQVLFCVSYTLGSFVYIINLLAIATFFSLSPLYFFLVGFTALLMIYLPQLFVDGSVFFIPRSYRLILLSATLFGGFVSFLHFLSTIELFVIRERLRENRSMAELALSSGNLGYWTWDIRKDTLHVDQRWFSMLGYEEETPDMSIRFADYFQMVAPEDRTSVATAIQRHFDGEDANYKTKFRMLTADGRRRWIHAEGQTTHWDEQGEPLFMHGIHQDIQEVEDRQRQLAESEARFKAYTKHSPVAIYIVHNFRFKYVNTEGSRLTGYSAEELLGKSLLSMVHPEERHEVMRKIRGIIKDHSLEEEYGCRLVSKTGEIRWAEIRVSVLDQKEHNFLLSVVDVTEKKIAEQKLREYATYDELTGVFNRRVGIALLEQEIRQSKREVDSFSICFVDVNGLKTVNDNWGHDEGDTLIRLVVRVIQSQLRKGDVLCRLGGDEFLIILRHCNRSNAERIWHRVEQKFEELNRLYFRALSGKARRQ